MSSEAQTLRMAVLLFTDIVDSVGLERRLGTESYSRLLKMHHQLFRQVLAEVGAGRIHLDTGDGFLSEFATPAEAVNTALLFQLLLRETAWGGEGPKVRVGIHQGQLAEIRFDSGSPGKIVGLPVSIASRVMSLAQPGQILLTRPVYEDALQFIREHPLPRHWERKAPGLRWKAHGSYVFQGTEGSHEIFEAGAAGLAPLTAPQDSEKARRATTVAPRPLASRPRPALAAVLTAVCGLGLWALPPGERWANASYDCLFRFGARNPTNKVALIVIDNAACDALGQSRDRWDRSLHADLLNKLTDAGCPLVVFDILFKSPRDPETDARLAAAMRRHGHVVLMTGLADPQHPKLQIAEVIPPHKMFLQAANSHGIGQAAPGLIVRQHWPFPAPPDDQFQSLPWAAARLAGAHLNQEPTEQWLRYYGEHGAWETYSYHLALSNAAVYFAGKTVFIGNKPENPDASLPESDKFRTPYTRWTGEAAGGVEILATTFLNLMNGDWLRRPSWAVEASLLLLLGAVLGGGFCRFARLPAVGLAAGSALVISLAGVSLSYFTNFWFPWLIVVGGQVPCALACALLAPARVQPGLKSRTFPIRTAVVAAPAPAAIPDVPNYQLFGPPVGTGGFGEVWVARSLIGQWQAIKVVYRARFGDNPGPYEAEFNGLKKYKPVSERHPGLLRIELIGEARDQAHFYYVMELGDPLEPGWEDNPSTYKPRDLETLRKKAPGRRLSVAECLRIGSTLAEALEFLHGQGLTHRDIKPSNVIFVQGQPKLADVGLVTDIRAPNSIRTWVGTAGYMPPPPEKPGTAQADIFALGMLLYVVSTGRDPELFPALATTLIENSGHGDFMRLNAIILKACQPDLAMRYQTTGEMARALRDAAHHLRMVLPENRAKP